MKNNLKNNINYNLEHESFLWIQIGCLIDKILLNEVITRY